MTSSSEDHTSYKELIKCIRSADEDERRLTIARIPHLVLAHFEEKSELIKQILLLVYNLNTESEIFEYLTLSNGSIIIRHLLKLYLKTTRKEQKREQVEALVKLVHHFNTPELLIDLANILYYCLDCKQLNVDCIGAALDNIREKAAANMYPDVLLMIHSIMAKEEYLFYLKGRDY